MELGHVYIEDVKISEDHRPVDQKIVDALAESMSRVGLQSPILIFAPDEYTVQLVAGQHRVQAAKKLEWEQIDCFFITSDVELNTIDENLIRKELTSEQRDAERARRVKRIEELSTLTVDNSPKVAGRPKSAITQVAEEEGVHVNTVRQSVERHEERQNPIVVSVPDPDEPFRKAAAAFHRLSDDLKHRLYEEVYEPWYALGQKAA